MSLRDFLRGLRVALTDPAAASADWLRSLEERASAPSQRLDETDAEWRARLRRSAGAPRCLGSGAPLPFSPSDPRPACPSCPARFSSWGWLRPERALTRIPEHVRRSGPSAPYEPRLEHLRTNVLLAAAARQPGITEEQVIDMMVEEVGRMRAALLRHAELTATPLRVVIPGDEAVAARLRAEADRVEREGGGDADYGRAAHQRAEALRQTAKETEAKTR
jgi:hypothetical protein